MFELGEYVVCGNNGVCQIKDITQLSMGGVDKNRKYYILKPVYSGASTIYIPVDTLQSSMRKIISKKEADELVSSIPAIQVISIEDEKTAETQYRECMMTNLCTEWIKLWKTLYYRNKKRLEKGHKVTAVDGRYIKLVEDNLCGELAIVWGLSKPDVEKVIISKME